MIWQNLKNKTIYKLIKLTKNSKLLRESVFYISWFNRFQSSFLFFTSHLYRAFNATYIISSIKTWARDGNKDLGDFDVAPSLERKNPSTALPVARDERGEVREAVAGETATLFSSPFLAPHAPSTTSGIDEIDCGGCISKRGPTWGSSSLRGGDGMLYSPPLPIHSFSCR